MDKLSYCILSVIFSYLDNFSLALFKITNNEYYDLIKNSKKLINYEISLKDLIYNNINLKFHNFYYNKYIRNNSLLLIGYDIELVKFSMHCCNNFDIFEWYLKKVSLTKEIFECLLEFAIENNLLVFVQYFLENRKQIQKEYTKKYYSDDKDLICNPRKHDIINEKTISKKILESCLVNERKSVIKLFKKYNCVYKFSFINKIIELNKLKLFKWFIKKICNYDLELRLIYNIHIDFITMQLYDFLYVCKNELNINSKLKNYHIENLFQIAIRLNDDKMKKTLIDIFEY